MQRSMGHDDHIWGRYLCAEWGDQLLIELNGGGRMWCKPIIECDQGLNECL